MVQSLPGVQSKVFMAMKCLRKELFQDWFCDINIASAVYKGVSERLWTIFSYFSDNKTSEGTIFYAFSFSL